MNRLFAVPGGGTILSLTATNATNGILGFLYVTLAARILSADAIGQAAATIAFIGLIGSVSTLGTGVGLARFRDESDYSRLAVGSLVLTGLAATLTSSIAAWVIFTTSVPSLAIAVLFLPLAVLVQVMCGMLDALAVANRDTSKVLWRNLIANALRISLLVLIVEDAVSMVWTAVGAFAISAIVVLPFRKELHPMPSPSFPSSRFLVYSLRQFGVTWAYQSPTYLLPILVLMLISPRSAGFFAVAWGVTALIAAVGDAAAMALLVEGSRRGVDIRSLANQTLGRVGIPLVLLCCLVVALAPLLRFAVPASFAEAMLADFRILTVAAIPHFLVAMAIGWFRISMQAREALVVAGLSGLGSCGLMVVLSLGFQIDAPSTSYLVGNVVAAIAGVLLIGRTRNKSSAEPHIGPLDL